MTEEDRPTLFQSSLGDRWAALPSAIRELHGVQDIESFSGVAEVTRGHSLLARIAAWVFGLPPAGNNMPVTVTITRTHGGETWERNFAGRVLRSYCSPAASPYRYRERFGLFTFEQDLPVENGRMSFAVRRGWFLGIPIPRFLLPGSDTIESTVEGKFRFDVALSAPLKGGLIVRYRGALTPDRQHKAAAHASRSHGVAGLEEEGRPQQA